MTNKAPNYLQSVRDQYEDYPYPERNPDDEKSRLYNTFSESLDLINYYCFEGKRDFFFHPFRVLIAGGGTGDATIYLAEQLRQCNAEIVYVDISQASMAIAKKRAEIRGLTNIRWVHDSLLEVGNLGLGEFDYITCVGVLHHLADPDAGLRALASVLREDGAMCIMVYAQYGRTGTYHMQALMRHLCRNARSNQEKVDICKEVLTQLPASNWHALAAPQTNKNLKLTDEIEIYDLFLHSQDRAYSIPQLYQWVEINGLQIVDLLSDGGFAKTVYHANLGDEMLMEKISAYPLKKRQAIAELAGGYSCMHGCYIAKTPRQKPQASDLEQIPFFSVGGLMSPELIDLMKKQQTAHNQMLTIHGANNIDISFQCDSYSIDLFRFINGERTIGDIINCVIEEGFAPESTEARAQLLRQFEQLFHDLNLYDWLLLQHKSTPKSKSADELQAPITAKYSDPIAKKRT